MPDDWRLPLSISEFVISVLIGVLLVTSLVVQRRFRRRQRADQDIINQRIGELLKLAAEHEELHRRAAALRSQLESPAGRSGA